MSGDRGVPRLPVLLLGSHITALGVLRVLQARGIPTYVVDATTDIIVRSRWYRPPERTLVETPDSAALAEYLTGLRFPRAVLIPCSDPWAHAVSGLPTELGSRFPASMPPLAVVQQCIDKARFRELVDRLGIPAPRTLTLEGPADLDGATDDELRSGFLKPTDSQRFCRAYGTKGFFVSSRAEAARRIEAARAFGITFMLQDWIPGDPARSYLIDGFVDRHGTLITLVARRRIRIDPPRIANTASHVTVPLDEAGEAIGHARSLVGAVGYRGIFNIEFKHDPRDGHFKIIELNPRPFWHIGHVERAGVDLPSMAYLDAQELPVAEPPPYQIGRYGVYEISDGAALMRAWGSFRCPTGPVIGPWLKGDHTLLWWRDPMPGADDLWRAIRRRAGDRMHRLRGGFSSDH